MNYPPERMKISSAMREAMRMVRVEGGHSQSGLASSLGQAPGTIKRHESGSREMTIYAMAERMSACGVGVVAFASALVRVSLGERAGRVKRAADKS